MNVSRTRAKRHQFDWWGQMREIYPSDRKARRQVPRAKSGMFGMGGRA